MSGIYVSSRSLATEASSFQRVKTDRGRVEINSGAVLIPGDQTTTSFRTGGVESDRVSSEGYKPFGLNFPTGDTGHEFDTVKRTVKCIMSESVTASTDENPEISGHGPAMLTEYGDSEVLRNFPVVNPMSKHMVNTYGTKLISSAIPTTSKANTLLTLSELVREGLPSIPLRRFGSATSASGRGQAIGHENLNWEFGIKPLISDAKKIAQAVLDAPALLEQFRKDSGKSIRRTRYLTVPDTYSEREVPVYPGVAFYGANPRVPNKQTWPHKVFVGIRPLGKLTVADRVITTVKFSGAFTYYLDVGDDAISKLKSFEQQANHLLGLRLTPEVLWNLSSWSWLADWFGNIGPILGNASAFQSDGLVLQYGYLMRHTVANRYLTYRNPKGSITPGREFITRYRTERKERVRATPFGFGLSNGDIGPRKAGILASLAVTRAQGLRS